MRNILVTGGLGYIGAIACSRLSLSGFNVIALDNLSQSHEMRIHEINATTKRRVDFHHCDIRDGKRMLEIIKEYRTDTVLHLAALKSVSESETKPELYYDNNVFGTEILIESMLHAGCQNMVFSSSACVYGRPHKDSPLTEEALRNPENNYGRGKKDVEDLLCTISSVEKRFNSTIFRFFNPVGCLDDGSLSEDAKQPSNLFPVIANVLKGKTDVLTVFGKNHPTRDGTCIRDYIHVLDLVDAIEMGINHKSKNGIYNIGTGRGTSVAEILNTFSKLGYNIPHGFGDPREGDIPSYTCSFDKIRKTLGWSPKRDVTTMCESLLKSIFEQLSKK